MKIKPARLPRSAAGFTLVEVMISMVIVVSVLGMALSTFLFGLRTMYKDTVRLQTNGQLRYFTSQMSKETVDSSEFYLFQDYSKLDGSVDIDPSDGASDMAIPADDGNGSMLASGDCIVLVQRTSIVGSTAAVRQIRIYFRVALAAGVSSSAPIRYYESPDYGTSGSGSSLATLLNGITLSSNALYQGTGATNRLITATARGRKVGSTTTYYPIFCSEGPSVTSTNENFSINVEFITGNSVINMLSSSSFNYTVSPRR